MKKYSWESIKNKTSGVKQFGQWKLADKIVTCQIRDCDKEANWVTLVKNVSVFLCFGHGEDA